MHMPRATFKSNFRPQKKAGFPVYNALKGLSALFRGTKGKAGLTCIFFLTGLAGLLLQTCSPKKGCRPDVELGAIRADITLTRFERKLFNTNSPAELEALLNKNPVFARRFLQRGQVPDTAIIAELARLRHDPYIDTMFSDCERYYGNLDDIYSQLQDAFKHVIYYYPAFRPPPVYTVVSGFGTDLFITDSLAVIGLECFLGDSGHYVMPNTPKYITARMKKPYIVPSLLMVLSNKYNKTDVLDNSLLGEMIQWGKTYYFMEKMLPCVPDSLIIGYTGKQTADVEANLSKIYSLFVERKLFFETNHMEVNRYIGERPFTYEVGNQCPGRIGRYLGWKIVQAYAEEKKLSLQQIMAETDARKIFADSRFKPKLK